MVRTPHPQEGDADSSLRAWGSAWIYLRIQRQSKQVSPTNQLEDRLPVRLHCSCLGWGEEGCSDCVWLRALHGSLWQQALAFPVLESSWKKLRPRARPEVRCGRHLRDC